MFVACLRCQRRWNALHLARVVSERSGERGRSGLQQDSRFHDVESTRANAWVHMGSCAYEERRDGNGLQGLFALDFRLFLLFRILRLVALDAR